MSKYGRRLWLQRRRCSTVSLGMAPRESHTRRGTLHTREPTRSEDPRDSFIYQSSLALGLLVANNLNCKHLVCLLFNSFLFSLAHAAFSFPHPRGCLCCLLGQVFAARRARARARQRRGQRQARHPHDRRAESRRHACARRGRGRGAVPHRAVARLWPRRRVLVAQPPWPGARPRRAGARPRTHARALFLWVGTAWRAVWGRGAGSPASLLSLRL